MFRDVEMVIQSQMNCISMATVLLNVVLKRTSFILLDYYSEHQSSYIQRVPLHKAEYICSNPCVFIIFCY